MEENGDGRHGDELGKELDEDRGRHLTRFIEEDSKALYVDKLTAAKDRGELEMAIIGGLDEVGGLEAVRGFSFPLLFFAEPPEDED